MKKNTIINLLRLKELEDLTSDDGGDFVVSVSKKFLTLLPNRVEAIGTAVITKSFTQICRETHSFKISCEIVGAEQLTECLVQLELAAQKNEASNMATHLTELVQAAEKTKDELQFIIKKRQTTIGVAS